MTKFNLEKCKSSNKGITLIALIITIIVLLILAGITISALTGSDSAPARANEAKQKNDIGAVKDEIALTVQNAQMDAYDDIYAKNNSAVKSTSATTTVGQRVINAVLQHFGGTARTGSNTAELTATDTKGLVSVSITQASGTADAEITLATRDFTQEGTIAHDGGTLTWEALENNSGNQQQGGEDTPVEPDPNEYGLFDAEGNQLASWEELVAAPYYLDIEKTYVSNSSYSNYYLKDQGANGNSMSYVIGSFPTAVSVKIPESYTISLGNNDEYYFNKKVAKNNLIVSDFEEPEKIIIAENEKTQKSITKIGSYAFYNCSRLTSITIPDSVSVIGYGTFWQCTGLISINLPDGLTRIGAYGFAGCDGLTNIIIPSSVTEISNNAFEGCDGLTNVTIQGDIMINHEAFRECSNLTSFSAFGVVDTYGNDYDILEGCNNLSSMTVDSDFFRRVFYNRSLPSNLTSVTIPDGVTSIVDQAFCCCSDNENLTSITIPDSVTSIGNSAFSGCTGLTSITIPDSVTSIGNGAFYGCTGLTSITIPESVESIGSNAFSECSSLATVNFASTEVRDYYLSSTDSPFYGTPWFIANYVDAGSE